MRRSSPRCALVCPHCRQRQLASVALFGAKEIGQASSLRRLPLSIQGCISDALYSVLPRNSLGGHDSAVARVANCLTLVSCDPHSGCIISQDFCALDLEGHSGCQLGAQPKSLENYFKARKREGMVDRLIASLSQTLSLWAIVSLVVVFFRGRRNCSRLVGLQRQPARWHFCHFQTKALFPSLAWCSYAACSSRAFAKCRWVSNLKSTRAGTRPHVPHADAVKGAHCQT